MLLTTFAAPLSWHTLSFVYLWLVHKCRSHLMSAPNCWQLQNARHGAAIKKTAPYRNYRQLLSFSFHHHQVPQILLMETCCWDVQPEVRPCCHAPSHHSCTIVLCTQAPSVTQQQAAVLVQTAWRKSSLCDNQSCLSEDIISMAGSPRRTSSESTAVGGAPSGSQDSNILALQQAAPASLVSPAQSGQTASSCTVLSAAPAVPADQALLPCDPRCLESISSN